MSQTGYIENYTNLDPDIKDRIIFTALELMTALAKCADNETVHLTMNAMSDVIHPELKHDLLVKLLTKDYGLSIIITSLGINVIDNIRTVRQYTGLGLKEAKDICDQVRAGHPQRVAVPTWKDRKYLLEALTAIGTTAS